MFSGRLSRKGSDPPERYFWFFLAILTLKQLKTKSTFACGFQTHFETWPYLIPLGLLPQRLM